MPTFGRSQQSTRAGSHGSMVIEGDDLIVQSFVRQALTIAPKAGAMAVLHAEKAAERMRSRVHIDHGDLLDSIAADHTPTITARGVYADAGPDPTANSAGAFKGPFFEHGTVKMAPDPFVGPAGDETLPEFAKSIRDLA